MVEDIDSDGDAVFDCDDFCPGTSIPEAIPTSKKGLGVNRWALIDGDTAFDTIPPNGVGPQLSFTLEDTLGCSCEQIVEYCEYGNGHIKFGCSIGVMEEWVAEGGPFCE